LTEGQEHSEKSTEQTKEWIKQKKEKEAKEAEEKEAQEKKDNEDMEKKEEEKKADSRLLHHRKFAYVGVPFLFNHVRRLDVEAQITSKESKNTKAVSNDSSPAIKKKNDELRAEAKASDKEKTLRMKLKKELKSKKKYYASLKEDPVGHIESPSDQLKKTEKEASVLAKKARN